MLCIGVLVRGHDLGTSLLFFGLFVVLLYVATERASWVIIGILLFAGGAYVAYQLFGTVQTRVGVWLDPFASAHLVDGYQMRQSLFGLGTGGIFGAGLGSGHPELVPLPATDFIFTSFAEEIGIFGVVAILLLYVIFVGRGFAAALAVRDAFGKLLATGLVVPRRAPGLRRRRRRDPTAAGDGPYDAVPLLRWLVTAGQLHAACVAVAHLRCGTPADLRSFRTKPCQARRHLERRRRRNE